MDKRSEMDPLLISYLLRETSPEEDSLVREWIRSDEENRRYFETLSLAWRSTTEQQTGSSTDTGSSDDIEGEWGHFQGLLTTRRKRRAVVRRMILSTAAAAAVVVVILWRVPMSPSSNGPIQHSVETTAAAKALWQQLINTSDRDRFFTLSDGSAIRLSPNSQLSYRLTGTSRELALNGEARFTVAKDGTRPFSVYSGDIVTMALGTTFSIKAFPNENDIIIQLQEGKVVVRSIDSVSHPLAQDFYLLPGNQLVYDKRLVTARLGSISNQLTASRKAITTHEGVTPVTPDSLSISQNETGSWYMFNNQSLEVVLDQLQEMFQTKIVYSRTDVKNKYFIGKFDKSDSLVDILKKITLLNELKLTQKDNVFLISK